MVKRIVLFGGDLEEVRRAIDPRVAALCIRVRIDGASSEYGDLSHSGKQIRFVSTEKTEHFVKESNSSRSLFEKSESGQSTTLRVEFEPKILTAISDKFLVT